MKEQRIIALISIYGCLILANTMTSTYIAWGWVGLAIFWLVRYIYLNIKY